MDISKIKAIITGGSSGIGLETARLLSEKGAKVFICSRTLKDVNKAKTEYALLGSVCDVSNPAQVRSMVNMAIEEMDGLNVVINNAGFGTFAPLTELSLEAFSQTWQTNTLGSFLVAQEAAKYFKEQHTGNIINVGSTAAQRGFATGTAYCASKFALTGMTQCWQAELRPFNIRVMQINPSEVVTPFLQKSGFELKNNDRKLKSSHIAQTIVSLLSMDAIGFTTETTIWATNPF